MILDFPHEPDEALLSTPFEDWCARSGLHPDALDAWTLYENSGAAS